MVSFRALPTPQTAREFMNVALKFNEAQYGFFVSYA
eukprot:CAMPEP_0119329366 /NCGR_PEP_ID=MMETSP1333-20130426/75664_1 /TAXON_ID=418940 /ORGANISM="Scyphosphaera apsteinii, Strain RCC1455" /LENGTH=35 /DNA_ID= /DNA_START= /DNA_END= /DNA_ORIENTATION=